MHTGRGNRYVRKASWGIVSACAVLVTLSACASSGALRPIQARDLVEKAPGVTNATVTTGTDQDTLGKSYYVNVRLKLENGLSDAEQRQLIGYSAATGWATDIGHEPYGLRLRVTSSPAVDTWRILKDLGVPSTPAPHNKSFVLISAKDMNAKWGRWPSAAPTW